MGCLIQLGRFMGMGIHMSMIMGYGGTHGVWGRFYIDKTETSSSIANRIQRVLLNSLIHKVKTIDTEIKSRFT